MPNNHHRTATRHFCFDVAGAAHEYFRLRVFTSSAVQGWAMLAKSLGAAGLREMRRLAGATQLDEIRRVAGAGQPYEFRPLGRPAHPEGGADSAPPFCSKLALKGKQASWAFR